MVNSQSEIETFTNRYVGKLIKAKTVPQSEANSFANPVYKKKRSSAGLVMIIIILIIVVLVVYGISTGWIQEKFNLQI